MRVPAQTFCCCEATHFLRLRRAELQLVLHKKISQICRNTQNCAESDEKAGSSNTKDPSTKAEPEIPAPAHLPPKHDSALQRDTLPHNSVAPGAQQRAQSKAAAAIVQCFVALGSWSCAPTETIFLAKGRTSKNEVFSNWKGKGTAKLQMLLKSRRFQQLAFAKWKGLASSKSMLEEACSETSEKFQKTWRPWNPEKDPFKMYLKIFQYPEQVQLSPDAEHL